MSDWLVGGLRLCRISCMALGITAESNGNASGRRTDEHAIIQRR